MQLLPKHTVERTMALFFSHFPNKPNYSLYAIAVNDCCWSGSPLKYLNEDLRKCIFVGISFDDVKHA